MIGAEGDSPRRAVLTLVGHVDLTTAPVLWERLVLEIGFGVNEIVVDMAGATFLDCVGLGVLVGASTRLRRHGGRLLLRAPAPPIARVLRLTGMETAFAA